MGGHECAPADPPRKQRLVLTLQVLSTGKPPPLMDSFQDMELPGAHGTRQGGCSLPRMAPRSCAAEGEGGWGEAAFL